MSRFAHLGPEPELKPCPVAGCTKQIALSTVICSRCFSALPHATMAKVWGYGSKTEEERRRHKARLLDLIEQGKKPEEIVL